MTTDVSGDCLVTICDDGTLSIDRADPEVLITDELLAELERGNGHPAVRLTGDVLTIEGTNRRVIYRIDREDFDGSCHVMRWPD